MTVMATGEHIERRIKLYNLTRLFELAQGQLWGSGRLPIKPSVSKDLRVHFLRFPTKISAAPRGAVIRLVVQTRLRDNPKVENKVNAKIMRG